MSKCKAVLDGEKITEIRVKKKAPQPQKNTLGESPEKAALEQAAKENKVQAS